MRVWGSRVVRLPFIHRVNIPWLILFGVAVAELGVAMKIWGSLKKLVSLEFRQQTTISTPASGSNGLFFKSDDHLYMKNSAGTVTQVDGGGGGSVATPTSSGTVTSYTPVVASSVKTGTGINYTILDTDGYDEVAFDPGSDKVLTLPALSSNDGRLLFIKNKGGTTGNITVTAAGSDKIDGNLTTFSVQWLGRSALILKADNVSGSWWVMGSSLANTTTPGGITSYYPIIRNTLKNVTNTSYTVLDTDGFSVIAMNDTSGTTDRTLTLPAIANNKSRSITIMKADGGTGKTIVAAASGEQFWDGTTTKNLILQNESITLRGDGSLSWYRDALTGWSQTQSATITADTTTTTANTEIDVNGASITLPIGNWMVYFKATMSLTNGAGASRGIAARVRMTNNSNTYVAGSSFYFNVNLLAGQQNSEQVSLAMPLTVTTSTTYKLRLTCNQSTATGDARFRGGDIGDFSGVNTDALFYAVRMPPT